MPHKRFILITFAFRHSACLGTGPSSGSISIIYAHIYLIISAFLSLIIHSLPRNATDYFGPVTRVPALHTKRPQCPTIKLRFQLQVLPSACTSIRRCCFVFLPSSSASSFAPTLHISFSVRFVCVDVLPPSCGAIKILQHLLAFCLVTAALVVIAVVAGIWQFSNSSF